MEEERSLAATVSPGWENLGFSYMKYLTFIAYYHVVAWERTIEDATLHISESSPSLHTTDSKLSRVESLPDKDGSDGVR